MIDKLNIYYIAFDRSTIVIYIKPTDIITLMQYLSVPLYGEVKNRQSAITRKVLGICGILKCYILYNILK